MAIANLERYVAAGGTVALGTDYAGYSCAFDLGMPMTELRLMEAAGMTPAAIVVAATSNAARVCKLGHELVVDLDDFSGVDHVPPFRPRHLTPGRR